MRRTLNGVIALVMTGAAMLSLATAASANPLAGGGYSSAYAGESIFTNVGPGQSGQFSAIFFNDGTQPWAPGVVGLLICAADKVTCNIPSNSSFAHGWYSQTVYATVTTTVAPGQNGFFIYNFDVPLNTATGTSTTFNGDVGLIANGFLFRPEGYYQVNTVPTPTSNLTVSPNPASIQVGTTLQFTVSGQPTGATVTWSVNGGCGAITTAGLFAATSMNSATQPCTVIASVPGGTGIAAVTVFGTPTSLGCSISPSSGLVANGGLTGGTAVARISLKDPNGNVVTNASSPQVNVANVTPALATMTPTGLVTPSSGVVTVNIATTTSPGDIQVSASAVGLTGCNAIVTSSATGPAVKTIGSFTLTPIAADGTSTSILRIDVTDVNGNRVISDNTTQITITRDSGSANVCEIISPLVTGTNGSIGSGSAIATVANGRVEFTVRATTTPGQCLFVATTNNSSITGTSAAMTTQIVGAANKLTVISNDSPHPASSAGGSCAVSGTNTDPSCTLIVVAVQDANGSTLTSDSGRSITVSIDTNSCTTSGGGSVTLSQATTTTQGRATFAFKSSGAYSACVLTFNSAGLNGTSTTAAWTSQGADHLACVFQPNPIFADASSTSTATVRVVDAGGNTVTSGVYGVSFQRVNGISTTLLNSNVQNTSNGTATFTVRSTLSAGTDTYTPVLNSGSLPHSATTCDIGVH